MSGSSTGTDHRYDAIPDGLQLNNTLQIVYNSANAKANEAVFDEFIPLNDTAILPLIKRPMVPADVEFELNVFFDVSDLRGQS